MLFSLQIGTFGAWKTYKNAPKTCPLWLERLILNTFRAVLSPRKAFILWFSGRLTAM